MKPTTATACFILVWLAAPIVWNWFVLMTHGADGKEALFSRVVVSFCKEYPVLAFLLGQVVGLLAGHWFEALWEKHP